MKNLILAVLILSTCHSFAQTRIITHLTSGGDFETTMILANTAATDQNYRIGAYDRQGNLSALAEGTLAAGKTLFTTPGELFPPQGPDGEQGQWITMAPMPTSRQELPMALLDGKIYVCGGLLASGLTSDIVEVYDPATDSWETAPPMPAPLHHSSLEALDGKLYVIGGYFSVPFTPKRDVFVYNPSTRVWSAGVELPITNGGSASVVLNGGIHVLGGTGSSGGGHYRYTPGASEWERLTPLPFQTEHLAATIYDGKIYIFGGRWTINTNQTAVYDPATTNWTLLAPMPTPRSGLAAATLGDRIYVVGGELPGAFDTNEEYDPLSDSWRTVAPMSSPRHGMDAITYDNKIYVIGGAPEQGFSDTDLNEAFSIGGETPEISHLVIEEGDQIQVTVAYRSARSDVLTSPAHTSETQTSSQRWRIYPGNTSLTWDGIAVVNLGGEATAFTVSLRDSDGQILGQTQYNDLQPMAKQLVVLSNDLPPAVDSYYHLEATQAVAVVALRGDQADSALLWENAALAIP
jgi:N-acetylneuraminic acid mutarotase